MNVKEKLTEVLEKAAETLDGTDVDEFIDFLIKNGVTVLPEGAIVLTREEINALNKLSEKQKKHKRKV